MIVLFILGSSPRPDSAPYSKLRVGPSWSLDDICRTLADTGQVTRFGMDNRCRHTSEDDTSADGGIER